MVADRRHHSECQHDQADVAVPAVPGPALVVVEAKLVLGALEAVLDAPALPFNLDQRLNLCARRAPGGEERISAVGDVASNQQAACPQADRVALVFVCFKVGQFEVSPII